MSSPKSLEKLLSIKRKKIEIEAYRSITRGIPRKKIFWEKEFSSAEEAILDRYADLNNTLSLEPQEEKDHWYHMGQNENLSFCFDAVDLSPSRFGDGFPVWYGSKTFEGSKAEVIYHLQRQAQRELAHTKNEDSIVFDRALFKAKVHLVSALDLREEASNKSSNLLEDGPPYPFCSSLGKMAKDSGSDGILSLSKRAHPDELTAVFDKNAVKSSKVIAYWDAEFTKKGEVYVCSEKWPSDKNTEL
ncbi:MAG: RES domain-containing protein [Proteobacteria bacterium]|nr:MAG: RES domain-containing protein [Pseudomonadota bacterium]